MKKILSTAIILQVVFGGLYVGIKLFLGLNDLGELELLVSIVPYISVIFLWYEFTIFDIKSKIIKLFAVIIVLYVGSNLIMYPLLQFGLSTFDSVLLTIPYAILIPFIFVRPSKLKT